jgi:hypothetical protein
LNTPDMKAVKALLDELLEGHGRETGFPVPPAQIPACAANAPGSSLGFWRRSGGRVAGVGS